MPTITPEAFAPAPPPPMPPPPPPPTAVTEAVPQLLGATQT
jgi:hypothetical protein